MKITKHTLDCGMTVLLEENHVAPVISFNILVYAGSSIETDDEAGLCHVIEHMIFKGTPARSVGEIARDVEASGGDINAYTSFDQTVFYINMASRFADKGLEILSDAVQNPLFDASELSRETEVICEEIRRGNDNPSHRVSEKSFNVAFTKHPYGRPIIGCPKTVKSFTREKILQFYRKWYVPGNMTFIVVGDFKSDEMLKKIKSAFSNFSSTCALTHLPASPDSPRFASGEAGAKRGERTYALSAEPPQTSTRVVIDPMNIQSSYFMLNFHVPGITHEDVPALDILSHILAGVESSRLEQVVKQKKQLVHNIYSYVFTPKEPGLFIIGGMMQSEKTLQAIDAILEEVCKMVEEPPSADELSRARINIRSSEIYERETVGGEAAKLAYFLATAGTHEFERSYFEKISNITSDDVRGAAQKYLLPENCTVTIVSPKDAKALPTTEAIKAAVKFKGQAVKKMVPPLLPKIHILKNGIKLIIRENHNLPIVSVYAVVPGGLRYETKKVSGISYLTSRTLTKGTHCKSAIEIAKKIESIAGAIEGFTGRNSIGLHAEFLSEKLYDGFGLFSEVLCEATFNEEEVKKERIHQIEAIQNQEDSLSTMVFVHFSKVLYGKHPYGMRMLGTEASVKKMTPAALKKWWTTLLNPRDLIISVVGDVSPSEVKRLASEWISIKDHKKVTPPQAGVSRPSDVKVVEHIKKEKEQAHIVLGFLGTKITSPDHYRLTVLNHILAGQGGRLFVKLRDQMSLAYAVNSIVHSGVEPGHFAVYIGTDPAKLDTAVKGIKNELQLIRDKLVSKEELERARQYLIGTFELDQQKNGSLAAGYALNELYGLGIGEIERYPQKILKVTREDVLTTARKYIDLDAHVISIIKPK